MLAGSATVLGSYFFGQGRAGRVLSSAPLPPGHPAAPSTSLAPPLSTPSGAASRPSLKPVPDKLGVPVKVVVADHQVEAPVSANRLNADNSLYVPPNPRAVSWASQDVAPGSGHGTIILVGHINSGGVEGAFANLADYRVGQRITLFMADGRQMKYEVAAPPIEVNKDKLGPRRQEMFDQTSSFGPAGGPKSGRLLLLSCGGAFDKRTGHYESNIFVYALPISS